MRIIRVWGLEGRYWIRFLYAVQISPNRSTRSSPTRRSQPVNETPEKTRKSRANPEETCKDPII